MEATERTTLPRNTTTVHVARIGHTISSWRSASASALLAELRWPRTWLRLICSGMLFFALVMLCTYSRAEGSKFSTGDLGYFPYSLLVEEKTGHHFTHGADLTFIIKPTEKARAFFRKPFLIRIFRVQGKGQAPRGVYNFLPCYVFLSVPYEFASGVIGEQVVVGRMKELGWLAPASDGSLGTGKFLLVFETLTDKDDVLRLQKDDKDEYFASGLYIEVDKSPARVYPPADVAAAATQTSAMLQQVTSKASLNDSNYRCYHGKRLADDETPVNWKLLASCEDAAGIRDDWSS